MSHHTSLDIVKGAILLEHRGKALYDSVLMMSKVKEVKNLFQMLSREEEKHIQILNKQYSRLMKGKDIDVSQLEDVKHLGPDKILSEEIIDKVYGAGYEAAVISAAIEFEKKAIKYYTENSEKTGSESEKKIFDWLADWEKKHLHMLALIDKELKEKIWYDNRFWPH